MLLIQHQKRREHCCYEISSCSQSNRFQMKRPRSMTTSRIAINTSSSPKRKPRSRRQILLSARTLLAIELFLLTKQTWGDDQSKEMYNERRKSANKEKGLVLTEDYCKRNFITISRLSVLCDTPGAYYYGSNAYRNSEVCMSGDKAKLNITLQIPKGLNTPIVFVLIEFGIYDQFQKMENTSLCQLPVTQVENYLEAEEVDDYWGDASVCPHPGLYQLETYYSMPSIVDYTLHYTPDVRLTFSNTQGRRIGCVLSGPAAIHLANERQAVRGLIFLGCALFAFICVFSILLYMSYRRKKRIEQLRERRNQQNGNRSRSQYFQTLPNGQIPRHGFSVPNRLDQTAEVSDEDDDDSNDALQISNPAYNETQIPTRPII